MEEDVVILTVTLQLILTSVLILTSAPILTLRSALIYRFSGGGDGTGGGRNIGKLGSDLLGGNIRFILVKLWVGDVMCILEM